MDAKGHPNVPLVDASDDQWVGHDAAANDPRYHIDRPWAHGRFTGGLEPHHVFVLALEKVDAGLAERLGARLDRLTFGGFYWNAAVYDYNVPRGWKRRLRERPGDYQSGAPQDARPQA